MEQVNATYTSTELDGFNRLGATLAQVPPEYAETIAEKALIFASGMVAMVRLYQQAENAPPV